VLLKSLKKVNFLESTDDHMYDDLFPEDYRFVFHLTTLSSLEYSPEVREGASLVNVGGKLFLFGGMSSRLDHNVFELDISIIEVIYLYIFRIAEVEESRNFFRHFFWSLWSLRS
jgi:hypothetical protein